MLQTEGYLAEVGAQSDGIWDRITESDPVVKKFSDREELTASEYNRLTTKKPIKVSSQEWALIRAQRKTKYGSLDEYDIPVIDFFRIGDYRIINNGFIYYIRNSGPDDFSVVMRKRIAPDVRRITREVIKDENRRNNAATDPSAGREGGKRRSDRSSGERAGNGRELSKNDRGTFQGGEPQRDLHAGQGNTDSGTVKRSDRDSDSVSNHALLATALEEAAKTDLEKQKIQEHKAQVALLDDQEKKLRELNAQIKELSFAKGKRDTKKISTFRDEAIMTTNRASASTINSCSAWRPLLRFRRFWRGRRARPTKGPSRRDKKHCGKCEKNTAPLGNLRTQVRNLLGNSAMKAVAGAKNAIAPALENIAYLASGKTFQRTRSFVVDKTLLWAAKADYKVVEGLLLDGGKYSTETAESSEFAKQVKEKRTIFKNRLLEKYREVTNWAMDQGDLLFSKAAYGRALAGYLQARGITDMAKADTELLDEARMFAVKEAQEQTFRDTNWLSSWVSKMGRRKDTPAVGRIIGEGVMPFRKTPANILMRAEEYSPLGLFNSFFLTARAMSKDSGVTGDQVINSWAKTLTGSMLFALGMWLSAVGGLTGGPDDDEELDSFESMYGLQNYAIVLPDGTNLTFD